jgi:hypothetical protein
MATFHVSKTFEVTIEREFFVLAGDIEEGEVYEGMFVRIPIDSAQTVVAPICRVEPAPTPTHDATCLLVLLQPHEWDLCRAAKIVDMTVSVTSTDE